MDNYLIYLLLALLILLLLLRRSDRHFSPSQQHLDRAATAKFSNKPPQAIHQIAPSTPVVPTTRVSVAEHLTAAQRFLEQQRYDDAIDELTQGLKTHKGDHQLSLKLLNVYAISKKYQDFDVFFQQLQQYAAPTTLAKARTIQTLVQQEHQSMMITKPQQAATSRATLTHKSELNFAQLSSQDNEQSTPVLVATPTKCEQHSSSPPQQASSSDSDLAIFADLERQLFVDEADFDANTAKVDQANRHSKADNNLHSQITDKTETPATQAKSDFQLMSAPAFELSLKAESDAVSSTVNNDSTGTDSTDTIDIRSHYRQHSHSETAHDSDHYDTKKNKNSVTDTISSIATNDTAKLPETDGFIDFELDMEEKPSSSINDEEDMP